jgi:hypothetical protein
MCIALPDAHNLSQAHQTTSQQPVVARGSRFSAQNFFARKKPACINFFLLAMLCKCRPKPA